MVKRISDIKKYERCEKMLWMSKRYTQSFMPFVYYHEDIYELVKKKLHIDTWLMGQKGDDNNVFFSQKDKYDAFAKIRFTYEDLRVHVPLMLKKKDGYDIYFIYVSCHPKEQEAQIMADVLWVLEKLSLSINAVYVLHLNAEYIRKDDLDVDELLVIDEYLYNDKNHRGELIDTLIKKKKRDVGEVLKKMDQVLSQDHIHKERSCICTRRNKCVYFDQCFPYSSSDTSVLNLVSCSTKFALHDAGYKDMADIEIDQIEGTRHQFSQLVAAKNKELVFDTYAVQCFFQNVVYPISYLDFEWDTYAFPPYEGMKPYDVLTFQYSLHIENEDGKLKHFEYLGKHDCRIEFIERLLADIPVSGTIMCYNVEGAEKLRLKQLAKQFPQYEDRLRQVWERMLDLSIPFSHGLIYDTRMAGMYSLKKLVSIFTDYSYEELDISHGMEAVRNYRLLESEDDEQQKMILQELLEYCAMDTYAEYLIYHWILEKIKECMD